MTMTTILLDMNFRVSKLKIILQAQGIPSRSAAADPGFAHDLEEVFGSGNCCKR